MTTLIHDTVIVTGDDNDTVHYGASIAIDGTKIAAIGPNAELQQRYPSAERIDGRGRMVMPGFANTHTHLTMTLARGVFEDLSPPHKPPFSGGLSPIPLPDMTPEERTVMAQLGALECLRSGVTFMLEDSNNIDDYAGTLAKTGLRFLFGERAYDRTGTAIGDPAPFQLDRAMGERHIATIEKTFAKWNGKADGRIRIAISAWAPDMCSPELLKRPERAAEEARHLDHHPSQPDLGRGRGGAGASQPAADRVPGRSGLPQRQGDLRPLPLHGPARGEAAGRGEDDRRLQRRDRRAPRPQPAHRIAGIAGLHHHHGLRQHGRGHGRGDAHRPVHGAHPPRGRPQPDARAGAALGEPQRLPAFGMPDGGWLAAGNKADLIMIDTQRAHLVPMLRAVSNFVHNGQARDVQSVMVDGQWLMRDGKVLTMDEPAIVAEAQEVANRAWSRQFKKRFDKVPAGFSPAALP